MLVQRQRPPQFTRVRQLTPPQEAEIDSPVRSSGQFENGLDTMVGERKGGERLKFLIKAKYDEILRSLASWSELGSANQRREAYSQGYTWLRKCVIVNVKA